MLSLEKKDWLLERDIVIIDHNDKYILLELPDIIIAEIHFIVEIEKQLNVDFVCLDPHRKLLFKWENELDVIKYRDELNRELMDQNEKLHTVLEVLGLVNKHTEGCETIIDLDSRKKLIDLLEHCRREIHHSDIHFSQGLSIDRALQKALKILGVD